MSRSSQQWASLFWPITWALRSVMSSSPYLGLVALGWAGLLVVCLGAIIITIGRVVLRLDYSALNSIGLARCRVIGDGGDGHDLRLDVGVVDRDRPTRQLVLCFGNRGSTGNLGAGRDGDMWVPDVCWCRGGRLRDRGVPSKFSTLVRRRSARCARYPDCATTVLRFRDVIWTLTRSTY